MLATFWMTKTLYVMVAIETGWSVSIQSLHVIWTVFISSHVTDHKFLEDVHKYSMQFSSQNSRFLCNRSNEHLKVSERPAVSRSLSVDDFRTSEQHRPDVRSSFSNFYTELDFSWHCLGSFYKTFGRRGLNVGTLSSISKYFGHPFWAQKGVTAKTIRTLGQAVWTWTYYEKNCTILKGGRRRPSGRG